MLQDAPGLQQSLWTAKELNEMLGIPPSPALRRLLLGPRSSPMGFEKDARAFIKQALQELILVIGRMDIVLPDSFLEEMATVSDRLLALSMAEVVGLLESTDPSERPSLGEHLLAEREARRERRRRENSRK